ncbi:MAG: hypothetical protein WC783_02205, partial [Candidatus Paceibacterota bacterium]
MSSELFLDNKKYISAKAASSLTGYSRDYIGQLARGNKIDSKKIRGVWYVEEKSLLQYNNFSIEPIEPTIPELVKNEEKNISDQNLDTPTLPPLPKAPLLMHLPPATLWPKVRETNAKQVLNLNKKLSLVAFSLLLPVAMFFMFSVNPPSESINSSGLSANVIDSLSDFLYHYLYGPEIDWTRVATPKPAIKPTPEIVTPEVKPKTESPKVVTIRGPAGPAGPRGLTGPQGPKGEDGIQTFNSTALSQPAYIPVYSAPIGIIPPNPATNYSGGSLFSATDLSSQNFTTSTANITNLSVSGNSVLQGNLNVTGTITGNFSVPGGGDMILASAQTNSGSKIFLDTTLLLRNVANTFNGSFTNTNTADRIYTLPDISGTVALTSDITGINSGTNTGDQIISDATLTTTDITTNDFTTSKHGFVPKGTNVGNFLRDDGTWAAPGGGGDMLLASIQTVTGAKTFDSSKLILAGATSGTTELNSDAVAGTSVITLPTGIKTLMASDYSNAGIAPIWNQNTTGNAATATNLTGLTATISNLNTVTGALGSAAFTASTAYAPALGVDDNYVTDAEKIVIGNTSGTNTGDNAVNSNYASDYRAANFVAGTDYLTPTGSAALLTNFPTFNQNTTGTAGGLSGTPNITVGTITSGLINGQTISSSANFTGSMNIAGNVGIGTASPTHTLQVGSDWTGSYQSGTSMLTSLIGGFQDVIPKVVITSSTTNNTGYVNTIGLDLHNDDVTTTGTRVPALAFSRRANATYTDVLGAIDAVDIGPGLDSNWREGALTFHTARADVYGITEKMRILGNGNVGIGVTNPTSNLQINVDNAPYGTLGTFAIYGQQTNQATNSEIARIFFGSGTNSGSSGAKISTLKGSDNSHDSLAFFTSVGGAALSERMRIGADGNVGIGTLTPAEKLDVSGNIEISNGSFIGTAHTARL